MQRTLLKAKSLVLVGLAIAGIIFGVIMQGNILAEALDAAGITSIEAPAEPFAADGSVRPIQTSSVNLQGGIDLGAARGMQSPKFPGIDAPYWVNSNGPAEIFDDARFYALNDARLGLINTAPAEDGSAANPVAVYDDLQIYGAGTGALESGNTVISGSITAEGNIKTAAGLQGKQLDIGSSPTDSHQISGDLQIMPGDSGVDIAGGNLNVTGGSITASAIGAFNLVQGPQTTVVTSWSESSASCPAGDELVSCAPMFQYSGGSTPPEASTAFATPNNSTCIVKAKKSDAATPNFTFNAAAICFSPNGN